MEQDTRTGAEGIELSRDSEGYRLEVNPSAGVAAGDPFTIRFKLAAENDLFVRSSTDIDSRRVRREDEITGAMDLSKAENLVKVAETVVEAVRGAMDAIGAAEKNVQIIQAIIKSMWPDGLKGPLSVRGAGLGAHTIMADRIIRVSAGESVVIVDGKVQVSGTDIDNAEERDAEPEEWSNDFYIGGIIYKSNRQASTYILELDENGKFQYVHGKGFKYVKVAS